MNCSVNNDLFGCFKLFHEDPDYIFVLLKVCQCGLEPVLNYNYNLMAEFLANPLHVVQYF